MGESIALIFQLFFIGLVQILVEQFVNLPKDGLFYKVINVGCFVGGLYVVLTFVSENMLPEMTAILNMGF